MAESVDQYLVGVSLPDATRAQEFLLAATGLSSKGALKLRDAVVVNKAADGRTAVHETIDPQPGRTALSSGVWTSLLGFMFGGLWLHRDGEEEDLHRAPLSDDVEGLDGHVRAIVPQDGLEQADASPGRRVAAPGQTGVRSQ